MPRPSFRRTMTIEGLEQRQVLSAAPDAMSQYALSLMNLARTNPPAAATWLGNEVAKSTDLQLTLNHYGVNLQQKLTQLADATPQPPLAWNSNLGAAALGHSQDMAANNFQSHTGSNGSTINSRIANSGYGPAPTMGEDAFAYASSVQNSIEAFLLDWGVPDDGHFKNIMQPGTAPSAAYTDVGVGVVATSGGSVGPDVVTIDFAQSPNPQPQLIGVVYNDSNGNGVYNPGEGQGGLTIQATNLATGQVSSTTSASAGGYQMPLAPGSYDVAVEQNGQTLASQDVTMGSVNVEGDFNLTTPSFAANSTPAASPAPQTQTVSQAPAAAQVLAAQSLAAAPAVAAAVAPVATPAPAPVTVQIPAAPTPAPASASVNSLLSDIASWTDYKANVQG